jgi:hypothetical protein
MNNKRLIISLLTGAVLGILCILGVNTRLGFSGNELFILSTWINRVILGLVIGLAPFYKIKKNTKNVLLRGAILGLIITGSFFIATDFKDLLGFFAGIVYGIFIDFIATKYGKE